MKEGTQLFYTVSEMAKKLGVAPSTLRYYDKEGLLPFVERSNKGVRVFKESDIEWFMMIYVLKKTGMPLKQIKDFISMALQGAETEDRRRELLKKHKEYVKVQLQNLQNIMVVLDYKENFFENNTDVQREFFSDFPEEVRTALEAIKACEEKE